ncbi:MAG: helix-turn-helix domain-containing protein [Candidatus Cloacimonetes bacterium]|nr:helix-turn-helix domain-containing protein [Candidatus Cloacimonadota bacterium]
MNFITLEEASKLLNLHPEVVRKKARSGEIPAVKLGTGIRAPWRFSEEALQNYLSGDASAIKESELHNHYLQKLLTQMKEETEEEKRVSAIQEIGLLGSEEAIPELTRNLLDDMESDSIKFYSIRALIAILGTDSRRYIYKYIEYPNPWLAIEAALYFAKKELDEKAIAFLKESYAKRKDFNSLLALAQIDYESVKDDYLALIDHDAVQNRYKALMILDNITGADYVSIVRKLLADREHRIKRKAIELTGDLKLTELMPELTEMLSKNITDDLKKCIGAAIVKIHTL